MILPDIPIKYTKKNIIRTPFLTDCVIMVKSERELKTIDLTKF